MNIKAERIEQLIQIVNRNLLLIYSGQRDGIAPIDTRRLQRVDAAVFDGDKFAFEMVPWSWMTLNEIVLSAVCTVGSLRS